MGTKRVGLARTQALIENLKRELAMGGTRFSNAKGVEMAVFSDEAEADGAQGFSETVGMAVPANSIITEVGVVVTQEFTISTTAKLGAQVGTSSGGAELIADNDDALRGSASGTLAVGKGTSTNAALATTALGGNEKLDFATGVAFSTSARTIYGSVTISTGNITAGAVRFYLKYVIIE